MTSIQKYIFTRSNPSTVTHFDIPSAKASPINKAVGAKSAVRSLKLRDIQLRILSVPPTTSLPLIIHVVIETQNNKQLIPVVFNKAVPLAAFTGTFITPFMPCSYKEIKLQHQNMTINGLKVYLINQHNEDVTKQIDWALEFSLAYD
jgi:hypothetical protein